MIVMAQCRCRLTRHSLVSRLERVRALELCSCDRCRRKSTTLAKATLRRQLCVRHYSSRHGRTPGSFPKAADLPHHDIWDPDSIEDEEGYWSESRQVWIYGKTEVFSNSSKENDTQYQANGLAGHAHGDHSILARLLQRRRERDLNDRRVLSGRGRSSSAPPPFSKVAAAVTTQWAPPLHKCPYHLSWTFSCAHFMERSGDYQGRYCMQNVQIAWPNVRNSRQWRTESWEVTDLIRSRSRRALAGRFTDRFWPGQGSAMRERWELVLTWDAWRKREREFEEIGCA